MIRIDTILNDLEQLSVEVSRLFNDGKEHEITIDVTPEESKQINKGINLHIVQKNIVKLGNSFDYYEYNKIKMPTGVIIQFRKHGKETTN